ncbi:bacillithiol biosynthesis deacetylase BshB1 [bacterium]|nr:bacillithiol biosynthesis deacetylase BshB1 [bacterium]
MSECTFDTLPPQPLASGIDFLAIGAHPDDVELGLGGTLAKLSRLGMSTGILDLTEGEKGTRGTREIRREERRKAGNILGVQIRHTMAWPDSRLRDKTQWREELAFVLRLLRPRLVAVHHANCRHPDHIAASHLVERTAMVAGLEKYLEGCQPQPFGLSEGTDLSPPPFRPDRVLFYGGWHHHKPSVIVDISEDFETKKESVYTHKSQFFSPESTESDTLLSDPQFADWLEQRARFWGFRIGVDYGEPLTVKGEVPIVDPVSTFGGCPW